MQNQNHGKKNARGSSPHQEMEHGVQNWLKNLRSMDQSEDGRPAGASQSVVQGTDQAKQITAPESSPKKPLNDKMAESLHFD